MRRVQPWIQDLSFSTLISVFQLWLHGWTTLLAIVHQMTQFRPVTFLQVQVEFDFSFWFTLVRQMQNYRRHLITQILFIAHWLNTGSTFLPGVLMSLVKTLLNLTTLHLFTAVRLLMPSNYNNSNNNYNNDFRCCVCHSQSPFMDPQTNQQL